MNLNKFNKIHFIGIGGIGVSAIAKIFLHFNKEVSGSDVYESQITKDLEKKGIKIFYEHKDSNLADDADLLIYSPAVPKDNPERQKAEKLNIKQMSYPEFLGEYSAEKNTIAIAGTNGKSTTTAMIGKIFEKAGFDPTVIVGTQVPGFEGNLRLGSSDILIIEACEWKGHMLNLAPQSIILTNLELDHLDYYKNLEDLQRHFQQFIDQLPITKGLLVHNADDQGLKDLTKDKGYQTKSFGLTNKKSDYLGVEIKIEDQQQLFKINNRQYSLMIPGKYNVYNALAAITVAKEFKIKDKHIQESLAEFPNCWRRFEILGPIKNKPETLVISDYAHHPTAIKGVIKAAREFYEDRRLFIVFQPHHYDRTAKLFNDFVKSFNEADLILVNEVYDVAGRKEDGERGVSSKNLVSEIQKFNPAKEVIYSPDLNKTREIILKKVKDHDLVLIIGAGDIDEVARKII